MQRSIILLKLYLNLTQLRKSMKKKMAAPITREEIDEAMTHFLAKGGKIRHIEPQNKPIESRLSQSLESHDPLSENFNNSEVVLPYKS